MKNLKKKGFTIVELVIVIAVIAILSAVLIPTFSSLIKKANLSNDKSFVRNANTTMAVEATLDSFESAGDAIDALNRNGFSGKYNTYSKNYHYCISLENAKMYLLDENNDVIFPEENVDKTTLWGLYMDDRTSFVDGIVKYVALENIDNSVHFVETFVDGAYTIDLNNHYIAVETNALNVTVSNGILISGASQGEGITSEYTIAELSSGQDRAKLATYAVENETEYKLSKLIFSAEVFTGCLNPYVSDKKLVIDDCIFYGVSLSVNGASELPGFEFDINNCKFIDVEGWAILGYSTMNITNCEFVNLKTRGAIQVQEDNKDINVLVENCTFDGTAADYPLIRFVGKSADVDWDVNIASLTVNNCNFTSLNKGNAIFGFRDETNTLYNYTGTEGEATITFSNNKIGDDISADEYVYNAGENCKLAELFAASVK